jgi:glycosyltransferase involved in cell wall biosynthesis
VSVTQVIIAALNEEEGIGLTIAELQEYLNSPRILVVDGKSRDDTVRVAKSSGADVIFQQGKGKGDAVGFGLKFIDFDVDYVVLSDADYTYPAEHIPNMIRVLEENPQVGMVCGNRFNSHFHLEGMGDVFYLGNRFLATVHNALNGVALRDPLTGLRVVRAQILKGWNPMSKSFDIEVELNHFVERRGFRIVEVPIAYRVRLGEKKLKLKDGAVILKRMLAEFIY